MYPRKSVGELAQEAKALKAARKEEEAKALKEAIDKAVAEALAAQKAAKSS